MHFRGAGVSAPAQARAIETQKALRNGSNGSKWSGWSCASCSRGRGCLALAAGLHVAERRVDAVAGKREIHQVVVLKQSHKFACDEGGSCSAKIIFLRSKTKMSNKSRSITFLFAVTRFTCAIDQHARAARRSEMDACAQGCHEVYAPPLLQETAAQTRVS